MRWDQLSSPALDAVDRQIPVLLNIGAIEQHGAHLPLATDAMIGRHFTDRIEARMSDEVLILPQLAVGCSRHHMGFAGTLTLRHESFLACLTDMLGAVAAHGFRNIVLFNSHGGNLAIGQVVLEAFGADHPEVELFLMTWWKIAGEALAAVQESGLGGVGHACEFETSLMLLIAPELVDMTAAVDQLPVHDFEWANADMLNGPAVAHHRDMHQLSGGRGVSGCPSFASRDKGHIISDLVTARAVAMLRDIGALRRSGADEGRAS